MKRIVVLTGAGMSAESGIQTFRGAHGLWEGHDVMTVASPEGFEANPELVLQFYNERRRQLLNVQPNIGHTALVELEAQFEVDIVTQNVDDLHERAGSSNVLHLHGELMKVKSTGDPSLIYYRKEDIHLGDTCEKGFQLRPHVVWFGEAVPMMEIAASVTRKADVLIIIGTSLAVYPAASLLHYVASEIPKYMVDPNIPETGYIPNLHSIPKKATEGVRMVVDSLLNRDL